jgi:hypothetical protein
MLSETCAHRSTQLAISCINLSVRDCCQPTHDVTVY